MPRERLASRGAASLATTELVALVIGSGTSALPVGTVATRLLRRHRLRGLAALGARALDAEPGVGPANAARLAAAVELGRRAAEPSHERSRPRLTRPSDAWRHVREVGAAKKERLVGLFLDSQNGLLHRETSSVGTLNTTRTHPREILHPAIVHLALGFILVHNHPSGCLEPSPDDIEFTR